MAYQQWQSTGGQVIHNDLLPHAWLSLHSSRSGSFLGRWHAGYEFTWHRAQGPWALRSQLDRNDGLEHRLNLRYQAFWAEHAQLTVLLTVDLAEFGSGQTWEGGSIRYTMAF